MSEISQHLEYLSASECLYWADQFAKLRAEIQSEPVQAFDDRGLRILVTIAYELECVAMSRRKRGKDFK